MKIMNKTPKVLHFWLMSSVDADPSHTTYTKWATSIIRTYCIKCNFVPLVTFCIDSDFAEVGIIVVKAHDYRDGYDDTSVSIPDASSE